jgi:hypothetical protein
MKRTLSLFLVCMFVSPLASAIDPAPAGNIKIYRDYQCTTGPSP